MQIKEYFHQQAGSQLAASVVEDVKNTLRAITWRKRQSSKEFRINLSKALSSYGWSDPVRIDQRSKISITSVFGDTGLCVQTGNVSRIYADFLKLETIFKKRIILGAIYIVPTKDFAKDLSGNVANFERLVDELQIFEATMTIPLVIFGISGDKK